MLRLSLAAVAASVAIVAATAGLAHHHLTAPERCREAGGRWGNVHRECVRPDCFRSSSCGRWKIMHTRCADLRPGLTRAQLWFLLGTPERQGPEESWRFLDNRVRVRYRGDTATAVDCGTS